MLGRYRVEGLQVTELKLIGFVYNKMNTIFFEEFVICF